MCQYVCSSVYYNVFNPSTYLSIHRDLFINPSSSSISFCIFSSSHILLTLGSIYSYFMILLLCFPFRLWNPLQAGLIIFIFPGPFLRHVYFLNPRTPWDNNLNGLSSPPLVGHVLTEMFSSLFGPVYRGWLHHGSYYSRHP